MLRRFLIFGLLLVAINADGRFTVLQSPDSVSFQGEEPILGLDVGNVVLAATGYPTYGDSRWSSLSVVDPFNLPKRAVVALIDGAPISIETAKFEVPLVNDEVEESLNIFVSDMKAAKTSTCDIDYRSKHASKKSHKCFGIDDQKEVKVMLPATKALSAEEPAAKNFLTGIADLNDALDNYLKLKDTKSSKLRSVIIVRMSLTPIVEAYGVDSAQQAEAVQLVKNALTKLQKASKDSLFIAVSGKFSTKTRSKREAQPTDKTPTSTYKLAENYKSDYPVFFNIILWFMVVFGLSLLAICYAIGSMDPGKDSIIYRMTSTRMKKDN